MECIFFAGKKKDSKLLFVPEQKMIYRKKSVYKEVVKYECWHENCKARVNLMPNGFCDLAKNYVNHNHEEEENIYKELCALNEIKAESGNIAATLGGEQNAISSVRTAFRNVTQR